MKDKNYEIYDIVTGRRIDKAEIKPDKSYIIYYPNEKWKIRTVVFDENQEIKSETYLKTNDRQIEIEKTITNILEKQGCKDIEISYEETINLDKYSSDLSIVLPSYRVNYIDLNGNNKERILESQSLKDIYRLDENGNEQISFEDINIQNVQIGTNSNKNDINKAKNNSMNNKERDNIQDSQEIVVNCESINVLGQSTVTKGNIIFNVGKEENKKSYDLRTDEGVQGLRDYIQNQRENIEV